MPLSNSSALDLARAAARDVLVTGVRSLLGAHLVAQPTMSERVRGVSRRPWTITVVPGETADILEPGVPSRLLRADDVVVHAAVRGPVSGRTLSERSVDVSMHTRSVFALLDAARAADARRVVLIEAPGVGSEGAAICDNAVARARAAGLDVRRLYLGLAVGSADKGPSWIGRMMLAFAAGRLKTFVPGVLPLVSAEDAGRALARLALDDELPASGDFALPSDHIDTRELFELWADEVGPRSRPWHRPAFRFCGRRARWVDLDAELAAPPRIPDGVFRLERRVDLPQSIHRAFAWFSDFGHLQRARSDPAFLRG